MTKPKFSYADHLEAAKTLKKIQAELQTLICKIWNKYPYNSKVAKQAKIALNKLDLLRYELDNRICEECDCEDPQKVYYGE